MFYFCSAGSVIDLAPMSKEFAQFQEITIDINQI